MSTAKVFTTGRSQAVRLPKEFRFDTKELGIKRIGSGVMLFPKKAAWDMMGQTLGKADDDFMADRDQPERADDRKSL